MDDLVRRGVARDQREAWEMVQTGKGRSPDVIAASLLASQNPRYMGANGRELAMRDAMEIVGSTRGTTPTPRGILQQNSDGSYNYVLER